MSRKKIFRVVIDFIMTLLLFFQMAYFYTDQGLHEWLGIVLFVLYIVHHVVNYGWIKSLFKGKWYGIKILKVVVNTVVSIYMLGLIISGLSMSMVAVPFFSEIGIGVMLARKIHLASSYGSFVWISIHIGLHFGMISGINSRTRGLGKWKLKVLYRVIAILLAVIGVVAVIKEEVLFYVLLIKEYVYFDFARPFAYYLVSYILIMALFVVVGHYMTVGVKKLKR